MNRVVRTFLFTFLLMVIATVLSADESQPLPATSTALTLRHWATYDWNAFSGNSGTARFETLPTMLQVSAATPNDARFVRELTVEPDQVYRFACQVRIQNVGPDGRGAGISVMDILDGSIDIKGSSSDWQSLEFYGKTGSGQNRLSVTVGIGGYGSLNSGTAWFRDITVKKVADVPPGMGAVSLLPAADVTPEPTLWSHSGGAIVSALGCFGVLLAWWGSRLRRQKDVADEGMKVDQIPIAAVQKRVEWWDVSVMAVLSVTCLLVSLFNLGGHAAPETGWQASMAGESVTVELDREVALFRIYYYCGINERAGQGSRYSLAVRNTDGDFVALGSFTKDDTNIWKYSEVDVRTTAVRLTADTPGGRLNEVAFLEKGSRTPLPGIRISDKYPSSANQATLSKLIDEQSSFEYAPSFQTGFYFDEIYHARTAWEMLHGIEPYETTHPPLGKLLISSGIALFGMNPFGWRFMGALFGVALVPLMYLFGLKLFRNRFYAFCAAFLMMVEFMRFAQSRVAVIDVYGVFFIMVLYYFILDLFPERGERPRRSPNLTLLLAGAAFGIGAACKWIALYAGCGVALLVVLRTVIELRRQEYPAAYGPAGFILRRIAVCLVAFGVLPVMIYLLSYVPYLALSGPGHGLDDVFRLQGHMLNYHRTLQATHPFSSPWWSWPLDLHPMWMYTGTGLPEGLASSIVSFGNPAIFWLGLPAIVATAVMAVRRRAAGMGVILVALFCQYLPWVGINRLAFIYHFFSSVPFLILCIVATLRSIELHYPKIRAVTWGYLGVAAGFFIIFYPILSGLQVPQGYVASLRWLPTWFF